MVRLGLNSPRVAHSHWGNCQATSDPDSEGDLDPLQHKDFSSAKATGGLLNEKWPVLIPDRPFVFWLG